MVVRSLLTALAFVVGVSFAQAQQRTDSPAQTPSNAQDAPQRGGQDVQRGAQNVQQRGGQDAQRGAQNVARPSNDRANDNQNAAQSAGSVSEQDVAAFLALGNHAEIELANLAIEKTDRQEVRQFAEQMVKDHTAFGNKLKQFMPEADGQVRTTAQAQAQGSGRAVHGHNPMLDFARKSSGYELSMTKQLLNRYDGQDFDMAYLGQQLVAHTKMLACLNAAKDNNVGSSEFQQAIDDGIQTTTEHWQHAQKLAMKFEDREDGQRRDGSQTGVRETQQNDRGDRTIDNGQRNDQNAEDRQSQPRQGAQQDSTPQESTQQGSTQQGSQVQGNSGDRIGGPSGTARPDGVEAGGEGAVPQGKAESDR